MPVLFLPGPKDFQNFLHDPRTLADLIRYVMMIGFFYLNYEVLVPRVYFQRKTTLFAGLVVAFYLLIVWLPGLVFVMEGPRPDFIPPPPEPQWDFVFKLSRHFLLFTLVFIFSLMLRITDRWKQAERDRKNAEVAFLQSQVNPHFLFNTLNSIYSLALEKSDQTPAAVVKLSNLMRYVITDAASERVPLEKEIDYLRNYISLQQIRFGTQLTLAFSVRGESAGKTITPLLFIPVVENAFKYGVNPEEQSVITIEIDIEPLEIHLLVENRKVHVQHTEKTGLGLRNLRQRLALQYPGKHVLTINENEKTFSVSLLLIAS